MRILLGLILLIASSAFAADVPRQITITPEASDVVLVNPGAGWQHIGYVVPKDEATKMPELSTFYTRCGWKDLESAPGKYGDTPCSKLIDDMLEYCKKHNRYFGFRVVTWDSGSKDGLVPEYVFQAGAKKIPMPNGSGGFIPVFWDKVYMDHHEKLVKWMGERWGKHPNLAYIDIPGGNWGEWNMTATGVKQVDDMNFWKQNGYTPEVWDPMVQRMVEMYQKAFPNRLIVSSTGMCGWGTPKLSEWCVARQVGFRDDGLGMSYATAGRHNPEFEKYWKKVPCFFENGYIDWTSWGDRSKVEPCLNWAIDQTHASIVTIGKNDGCLKAYTAHKDLVTSLGRKLGYRFEFKQASFYSHPRRGQNYQLAFEIQNTGNVPVYFDCKLEVSFVNDAGQVLGQELCDTVPPIKDWQPGAPIQAAAQIKVPAGLSGDSAKLCIGIVNAVVPEQRIMLPLKNTAGDRRYVLGPVKISSGGALAPANTAQAGSNDAPAPAGRMDSAELDTWNKKLVERVIQGLKDGQHPTALLKIASGKDEKLKIAGANEKTLTIDYQGSQLPVAWTKVSLHDRAGLAAAFIKDNEPNDYLLAAALTAAEERAQAAYYLLDKAESCSTKPDPEIVKKLRAIAGPR